MLSEKTRIKFKKRREKISEEIKKNKLTLEEIGVKFGVTKQRVRQIGLEFGIKRQIETRETSSMKFYKVMIDFNMGFSIAQLMAKHDLTRYELGYLYRQNKPTGPSLFQLYREKRDKKIIDLFKQGKTAKDIVNMGLKVLDDPSKVLGENTIYLINTKNGVKRYPKIGNRSAGGCFESKKILKLIVNLHDRKKNPLSFQAISDKLNSEGYKTLNGKSFSAMNVYNKYIAAKK